MVANASRSSGTPSSVRGRGRSAPRVQIWVDPAAGWTTSSPSSATSPTASGRRASIDSAPMSTRTPPTSRSRSLPPTTGELSSSSTDIPKLLSSRAATRPATPPPTTTTSGRSDTTPLFHLSDSLGYAGGTAHDAGPSDLHDSHPSASRSSSAVLGLIALSGCSGGGASGTAAAGAAADSASLAQVPRAASRFAGDTGDTGGKTVDASTVVEQRAVIKNGDIALHTTDPQQARDGVDAILTRLHGSHRRRADRLRQVRPDPGLTAGAPRPGRLVHDRDGRPREASAPWCTPAAAARTSRPRSSTSSSVYGP